MKTRWTLRQMLIGTFLIALILPYVVSWLPISYNRFTSFGITESELGAWLREIDPGVEISQPSGSQSKYPDAVASDFEYTIRYKTATASQLLAHINDRMRQYFAQASWTIREEPIIENDSFSFFISRGYSHYRFRVSRLPQDYSSMDSLKVTKQQELRIQVLQDGHLVH